MVKVQLKSTNVKVAVFLYTVSIKTTLSNNLHKSALFSVLNLLNLKNHFPKELHAVNHQPALFKQAQKATHELFACGGRVKTHYNTKPQ